MSLFYYRSSLGLSLFFAALALLIHAQPHDDRAVRLLLRPDACPMPCFLTIKPGLTHVDEALKILEATGWVEQSRVLPSRDMSSIRVEWQWNGLQPAIFNSEFKASLQAEAYESYDTTEVLQQRAIVESIVLRTTIHYGDVRLLLGRGLNRPDYVALNRTINRQISAIYSDDALVVQTRLLSCPVSVWEFWNSPVEVVIGYTQIDLGGRIICRRLV